MARRRKREHRFEALEELVGRVYPAPDQLPAVRVFRWWYRAVPERVAERARPVRLQRGVLQVHVSSSTWAQELSFLKADLLRRCQQAAPEARVRDIYFKVGKLPPKPVRTRDTARTGAEPVPASRVVRLPEDLARALAGIADDPLREAVTRAATTSLSKKGSGR